MRLLALDLATVTGWAYAAGPEAAPLYGSVRLARPGAAIADCFLAFEAWLIQTLVTQNPEVVVYEAPIITGRGSAEVAYRLIGLAAIGELLASKRGLELYKASGDTVTKAFTGRARYPGGRKEKKAQVVATCRNYGWDPPDDNAADALALLHYGQAMFNRRSPVARAAGPLFAGG